MSKRVALVLSEEALQIIESNSSERTRGEWVSGVLEGWEKARQVDEKGALERIEARLSRLEDVIKRFMEGIHEQLGKAR